MRQAYFMTAEENKLFMQKQGLAFNEPASSAGKRPSRPVILFAVAVLVLLICFSVPLYHLLQLAFADSLYSEIPLIPALSFYLIWQRGKSFPKVIKPALMPAILFFAAGAAIVAIRWLVFGNRALAPENELALEMPALIFLFYSLCSFFLGAPFMRANAFPLALLNFTVPFPVELRSWIDAFLQRGSAAFAEWFFQLSGTPVLQDGLKFHLPGCIIQVAPECSGIHSSLVLTIVSLVGGWLFLRSPWKRAALVLAVIPLALARNGFRIFVIGRLCTDFGPQMLASAIHRHGGPLFFALSMIPFLLFLYLLRKSEKNNAGPSAKKIL